MARCSAPVPSLSAMASRGTPAVASRSAKPARRAAMAEEVSDDMPGDAAASKTIEVDVQMDAKALLTQERMAPLIRAAEAEYWRLTRVGVAALCVCFFLYLTI